MKNKETPGYWKVSDSDNCQVVTENGVVVAQCKRPEDARMIALAPMMSSVCRCLAQDDFTDGEHIFMRAQYVTSHIGPMTEDSVFGILEEDEVQAPPTPAAAP